MDTIALFAAPLAVGVGVGYLAGGSLSGLLNFTLRGWWLLWLTAVVQACELYDHGLSRNLHLALQALTFALALAWLVVNLPGRPLAMKFAACGALVGGLANGAAVAANGRMPCLPGAARAAGVSPGSETAKNVVATQSGHLMALGDTIPVPPLHAVISIGDILIIMSIAAIIAVAMRTAPRHLVRHSQLHPEDAS